MAISFGRRGSGGGGGSSRVGFVSAKQSSTHFEVNNHASNFTNPNFTTPSWQLTLKESGRGEIVYSYYIGLSNAATTTDCRFSAKLQVAAKDTESATFSDTDFQDVELLPENDHLIYDELVDYDGEATQRYTLAGTLPFELSDLPTGNNNQWLRFRVIIRAHAGFSGTGPTIEADNGYIAFKSFGVGAGSTDINGANIRTGTITAAQLGNNSVNTDEIQNGAVTRPKIADDAIDGTKIADNAIGNEHIAANAVQATQIQTGAITAGKIGSGAVIEGKIGSGAVTQGKIGAGAVGESALADNSVSPAKIKGVNVSGATAGQVLKLNSAKTGFEFANDNTGGGGGGGGTPDDGSVTPAKMAGVNVSTATAGQVMKLNTAKTGFVFADDDNSGGGGGGSVTLANITGGPLALNKGGTGYAASDLDGLRSRLGIGTGGQTDPDLVRSTDADTQKDDTIHRFDSNTTNRPTGATEGIIVRTGDNQWMINVADGKTWTRTLSNTGVNTAWTTPVNAVITGNTPDLKRLQTESDFRTFAETDQGWTDTTNWLPQFSDGSRPTKVIVGRNGNYLVAIDRNNFFWAPRPTVSTWTEIPWRWEGTSTIPSGLRYTGGENDERLIPAGEDAVIAGKTNIPGENFVALLVDHSVSGTTSTFTGFYVDDDASKTLKKTTNTIGNSGGTWARTRLDLDGISSDIMVPDTDADGNERPAFVGVVPAISDLHFADYRYKTGTSGIAEGDVAYISGTRTVWIYHKTGDIHLPTLFAIDYEVSIHKDDSNYIRGVFDAVNTFPLGGGVTLSGGVFRAADLDITGTIAANDNVSIRGHKAVLTKTDAIDSVNLANTAVTPDKINGITGASGTAGQVLALNSAKTGFEWANNSGGGGGGGATNIAGLASEYSVLDDSYTFQSDVSSGVDDGKFGYTDSGSNGQIAFNVKSGDSSAISSWAVGTHFVLYKDSSNFVIGRATAAPQTEAGDSTEGAVSVTELERQGTFANGDSVSLYYGSHQPGAVVQLDLTGEPSVGDLSPAAMEIPQGTAFGSRVITTNANADGFLAAPPANVGMYKATLLCKQEVSGSGEISGVLSSSRSPLQTQTGTWVVANKATDWIRFSGGGLCYFGEIPAQPICADVEVWYRWKNGSESYQTWNLSNSRVEAVDLGSDRLMVVKLFAGGAIGSGSITVTGNPVTAVTYTDNTRSNSHVDCAIGSGFKFAKLSSLNSGVVDGTDIQFTLAFTTQNPSPSYTARRWFLTADIMDGSRVHANY